MTPQTLETIEKTVLRYCQNRGYQFKKHDGRLPYYTVVDSQGLKFFYNGNELADYMAEILGKIDRGIAL